MKKNFLPNLLLLGVVAMLAVVACKKTNDDGPTPNPEPKSGDSLIWNMAECEPLLAMTSDTINKNMDLWTAAPYTMQAVASDKSWMRYYNHLKNGEVVEIDGIKLAKKVDTNGTGYPNGTTTNPTPVRFFQFHLYGPANVIVYGSSQSGGSRRPMVFRTKDGVKSDTVWSNINQPERMVFEYTGTGEDVIVMSGSSSMQVFAIKVVYK